MNSPLGPKALASLIVVSVLGAGGLYYTATELAPSSPGCPEYVPGVLLMSFNNRTYCGEAISVDVETWTSVGTSGLEHRGNTTNVSFLGFEFSITPWNYGIAESILNTTVVEPNGTTYHGGPFWTGVASWYSNSWFTPDNRSGVYAVPSDGIHAPAYPTATVDLLVEAGV